VIGPSEPPLDSAVPVVSSWTPSRRTTGIVLRLLAMHTMHTQHAAKMQLPRSTPTHSIAPDSVCCWDCPSTSGSTTTSGVAGDGVEGGASLREWLGG
jgi:hypothetical protein